MKGSYSLRQRLLLAGTLGVLLVSAVATWLLGNSFESAALATLDRRLQDDFLAVLAHAESDPDGNLQMRPSSDQRYARIFSGSYWQVATVDGRVLHQSHSIWDQSLALPAALGSGTPVAYDLQGPMDQPLRGLARQVALPRSKQPVIFAVALDRSHLHNDAREFRQHAAVALGVLTALWLAVLAAQVGFGLRPLNQLRDTATRVRQGEDARFAVDGLPMEVAPLANDLNALLDHQARMVARARSSAEDLAHALKTPLAVLAAEVQGSGEQWRSSVASQVQRMRASVERYLAVGVAVDSRQRCTVQPVAAALARAMQRMHGPQGRYFDVSGCGTEVFAGAREDLEEMLGNLMDNAGRWASQRVQVSSRVVDGSLLLCVCDDGPGLPSAELSRVLQRGVRLDQRDSSSGLGLAIVCDIAESYGGSLCLENADPGLRALLRLPLAQG